MKRKGERAFFLLCCVLLLLYVFASMLRFRCWHGERKNIHKSHLCTHPFTQENNRDKHLSNSLFFPAPISISRYTSDFPPKCLSLSFNFHIFRFSFFFISLTPHYVRLATFFFLTAIMKNPCRF